jgi:hypothetical protein
MLSRTDRRGVEMNVPGTIKDAAASQEISKGLYEGDFVLLDPRGDVDLARKVVEYVVESGTPTVIVSRKVVGGQLPCLGFAGSTSLEMRPTVEFGLVVLSGQMREWFPSPAAKLPGPSTATVLYDIQYGAPTGESSASWSQLRVAFGGPEWPQDSPMYVSADGQPSIVPFEKFSQGPGRPKVSGEIVEASQKIEGWAVRVARVHAEGAEVQVVYTVTGPNKRFSMEGMVLTAEGRELRRGNDTFYEETIGPVVGTVSFWGLPEATEPREVNARLVVPAIHVRPAKYPCEVPYLRPEKYPTPTRIPNEMPVPGSYGATPEPDLETVGPFSFDLKVHVEPEPTQPLVPTPIPTRDAGHPALPLPNPTGLP